MCAKQAQAQPDSSCPPSALWSSGINARTHDTSSTVLCPADGNGRVCRKKLNADGNARLSYAGEAIANAADGNPGEAAMPQVGADHCQDARTQPAQNCDARVTRSTTRPRSPVAQLANKVNKTGTEYDVQAQQAGAHAPLPPGCVALTLVVSAVRHVHMQYSFPASCICQLAQWRF